MPEQPSGRNTPTAECWNCRYFSGSSPNHRGECHRYPPDQKGKFAQPMAYDWCGEHKPGIGRI